MQSPSSVVTRVIAGPGSGKTKVLTTRIAHLLHNDPYGKMLAVTFTRKAAGEMKERLEKLLLEQERVLEGEQPQMYDENTIVQERSEEPGVVDLEASNNPRGIERRARAPARVSARQQRLGSSPLLQLVARGALTMSGCAAAARSSA